MTQAEAVLGQIRLKSYAPTFSATEFVCRKTCVKNRSIVDVCHALMSCWDFRCGLASPRYQPDRNHQQQCCRLRNGGERYSAPGVKFGQLPGVTADPLDWLRCSNIVPIEQLERAADLAGAR